MTIFQTIADMKLNVLADLYNSVAEKPVKKFADKETAVKRVTEIAQANGMHLGIVDGRFVLVENEPDYTADGAGVDPTEDTTDPKEDKIAEQELQETAKSPYTEEVTEPTTVSEHTLTLTEIVGETEARSLAEQIAEAKAKREAEKAAAKPAKTKGGARGPAPLHGDSKIVKILVEKNPKKAGSASAARFELYTDGMTVGEFVKAGGKRADLDWDVAHKFIALS